MKVKIGFGWLSFEVDLSISELVWIVEKLRKLFPKTQLKLMATIQTCHTCKHYDENHACNRAVIDFETGNCLGFENYE